MDIHTNQKISTEMPCFRVARRVEADESGINDSSKIGEVYGPVLLVHNVRYT